MRTHLSALVNHSIVPQDRPSSAAAGLTKEVWSKYQKDKKVSATSPHLTAVLGRESPAVGPKKYQRCWTSGRFSTTETQVVLTASPLLCFSDDAKI